MDERVEDRIAYEAMTGCWLWCGAKDPDGYGKLRVRNHPTRYWRVHRFVYEQIKGPIPPGLCTDHVCRTRACVNPDHLRLVTPRVNVTENSLVGAPNASKTHCRQGHEYTLENTYVWTNGMRLCRTCDRTRQRGYRRQRRGKNLSKPPGQRCR